MCSNVLACREGYDGAWNKPETVIIKNSKWISVVEVDRVEYNLQKSTYFLKLIRNIKGTGPKDADFKIGPFPQDTEKSESLIWQDKGCQRHVLLEKGKQYILFSELNNPNSVQKLNPENESRISDRLK